MRILMKEEESLRLFYDALVNSFTVFCQYGFSLDYNSQAYKEARKKLKSPSIEEVWLQMLKDGHSLRFVDVENDGEYTRCITKKEVHKRVKKTPLAHLADIVTEKADAYDYAVLLQTVLFNEVIFG